jgi:FolB domain-containing protein
MKQDNVKKAKRMKATIQIQDLRVSCLIGCLARERLHPQTLRVDLQLEMDASGAGQSDRLEDTWDYAALTRDLSFVLQQGRFYLLEAAVSVLLRYMLTPPGPGEARPRPRGASITLTKFGVLPGQALPSVSLSATSSELSYSQERKPWGTVDVIAETRLLGLYRLNLDPGAQIPNHAHHHMRESELLLSDSLQGWVGDSPNRLLPQGATFEWEKWQPHGYHNPGPGPGSILCLDSPPFDPTDEVTSPRATP